MCLNFRTIKNDVSKKNRCKEASKRNNLFNVFELFCVLARKSYTMANKDNRNGCTAQFLKQLIVQDLPHGFSVQGSSAHFWILFFTFFANRFNKHDFIEIQATFINAKKVRKIRHYNFRHANFRHVTFATITFAT